MFYQYLSSFDTILQILCVFVFCIQTLTSHQHKRKTLSKLSSLCNLDNGLNFRFRLPE